jgi:hypothetical protein
VKCSFIKLSLMCIVVAAWTSQESFAADRAVGAQSSNQADADGCYYCDTAAAREKARMDDMPEIFVNSHEAEQRVGYSKNVIKSAVNAYDTLKSQLAKMLLRMEFRARVAALKLSIAARMDNLPVVAPEVMKLFEKEALSVSRAVKHVCREAIYVENQVEKLAALAVQYQRNSSYYDRECEWVDGVMRSGRAIISAIRADAAPVLERIELLRSRLEQQQSAPRADEVA